jgi:hypothetical protein
MIKIDSLNWKNCKNFNIHAFERLNERNISFESIKNLSWYIYDRKVSNVTGLYSINELHNYTANVCIVIDWLNVSEYDVITIYPLNEYKRMKGLKKLYLRH